MTDQPPDDHETSDDTRLRLEALQRIQHGGEGIETALGSTFAIGEAATECGRRLFLFYGARRSFPRDPVDMDKKDWKEAESTLSASVERTWVLLQDWMKLETENQEPPLEAIRMELVVQATQIEALYAAVRRAQERGGEERDSHG
jgi:hypothetical protein